MTSALNNLFFLTKDPPVPTHHRAQIDLSNLVPFPLQKIFTPLPNIFWTLLSKMWPILYEKCPILTNHISYWSKDFLRRKNCFIFHGNFSHFSNWDVGGRFLYFVIFPQNFSYFFHLEFGVGNTFHFVGILLESDFSWKVLIFLSLEVWKAFNIS